MSINIAILWESFGPYHFARFKGFLNYAEQFNARVLAVEVSNSNITYAWSRGGGGDGEVHSLFQGEVAERISGFRVYQTFQTFIKTNKIDVVFVPSYWPAYSFAAMLAAKSCNIKIVLMMESHLASGKNQGLVLFLKQALASLYDAALVGGRLHRIFVKKLGVPDRKIFDGYDAVDNSYYERAAALFRSGEGQTAIALSLPERFFLSLGRFVDKKNLKLIVNAYAKLVRDDKACGHALVFVGNGEKLDELRKVALSLGLSVWDHENVIASSESPAGCGTVYFHPFAQLNVVPEYYARATGFILASTNEEWGLVVNEAMAAGCPTLVSSAAGCAPDLVVDGKTGYIFNPSDVSMLMNRMALLCGDADHAKALGAAARVRIADWSCERFGKNAFLAAQAALGENALPRTVI